MDFRVLGPLEVGRGERLVPIRGTKERTLLAALLFRANRVVSRDLLIEELWGEHPPATAKHTLEAYVSRLRGDLAEGGNGVLIESQSGGYQICVEDDQLDVLRFERLLEEGRSALASGAPEEAEEKLLSALALWRGPLLADLGYEPFAEAEAHRLEELRVAGLEARLEAALALGRDVELVGELQSLVARYPLHERLRAQLMLALYRSGRQADALAVYREGRRQLVDELGIEPGPELQELEGAILRQEPQLQCPPPAPEEVPAPPSNPSRRAWPALRRSVLLAVAGAGAVVVVLTAVVALTSGSSGLSKLGPTSMGAIDPRTNRLTAQIPLGFKSSLVAAGEGHVWVVDPQGATLSKIDPRTHRVETFGIAAGAGAVPFGIAVGDGAVWLALLKGSRQVLLELGADQLEPRRTIAFGEGGAVLSYRLHPLAVGGSGAVWAIDGSTGAIWRIDPGSGKRKKLAEGLDAIAIAVSDGVVWVAGQSTVTKLDAATGLTLGSTYVGAAPPADTSSIAVGRNAAWFASSASDRVARIDEESMATTTFPVGSGSSGIAVGEGAVWVADSRDGTISRLDPRSGKSTTISLGQPPGGVVAAYGAVWTSPGEPRS